MDSRFQEKQNLIICDCRACATTFLLSIQGAKTQTTCGNTDTEMLKTLQRGVIAGTQPVNAVLYKRLSEPQFLNGLTSQPSGISNHGRLKPLSLQWSGFISNGIVKTISDHLRTKFLKVLTPLLEPRKERGGGEN